MNYRAIRSLSEDTYVFDTYSLFWNMSSTKSTRLKQPHCRGAGRRHRLHLEFQ